MATQLEKYEILNPDFAGTLPDKEDFATMLSANLELQNIIHREEGLSAPALSSATRLFDRQTPPTEAEIKGILNALAAEEAARVAQQEKKGKGKRTPAILCLAIAVLLLLAGVFVSPVLIAASAVFGIIALVLFLRAPKNDSSNPAFPAALAAKEMLSRYGLSTEGDLRDRLTELTLLSRQWREGEEAEQKRVKALQSLRAKKQQLLRTLQEKFRTWDILLPPKNDYRDDIEALRRDVSRVKRSVLETEERGRRRRAALDEQKRLQGELTPFLRHFDPKTTMKPSECLDRVREWETEYRRLSHRIPELRAELSRFVAEKRLLPDAVQGDISLPNVSVLNARESALHKELAEAQSHQAELKSHIGRLAIDVERLPEIEATVRALEEEYTIACANSETIANTARFLEEAKQGLSTRYLDNMHTSFSALLKALMDGESPETVLDPSFKVKLRQNGRTHPTEVLSQGWRDAVEFCIRLSLAEALYEDGEIPPIILDDPFVNLDERRLEAAKRLLVALSGKYQILYLICHSERR